MRERIAEGRRRHLLLAAVVGVAVLVRGYGLGAESLWVDEQFTQWIVRDWSLRDIVLVLPREDPHPTLYYVLLEGWTAYAGASDVGMRSFSVAAGVAGVPLIYAVGARLWDADTGLLAALLLALSPFYVWYGRDARMYALLTLVGLAALYSLVVLVQGADGERTRRRAAVGYVVSAVALCLTHAFGVLSVVAANAYVLGHAARTRGRVGALSLRRWIALQVPVAVATAPYFVVLYRGTFVDERFSDNVAWIPEATPLTPWKVFGTYVGRTVPPSSPWNRRSLWPGEVADVSVLGELVTLAALALVVVAVWRRADASGLRAEALLLAWLLVPIAALFALSEAVTPVLFDRYTAAAGVAALLLIARGLSALARTRRDRLVAAAAVVLVLSVPLYGIHAQPQKEQWEEATDVVEGGAESGDLVLVSPPWAMDPYGHYAEREDLRIRGVGAGAGPGAVELLISSEREVVWLVVTHQDEREHRRLVESVEAAGFEVDRHADLTDVDVYRFERSEERSPPRRAARSSGAGTVPAVR